MSCWHFLFEGQFREGYANSELKGKSLISTAMVPCSDEQKAIVSLKESLGREKIELIKIEESFLFNPDEVDFEDPENAGWIGFYEETVKHRDVIFTPWYWYEE